MQFAEPETAAPAMTAVLTAVLTEGPLSRVGLARRLGLSQAAVTKAARPLIERFIRTSNDPELVAEYEKVQKGQVRASLENLLYYTARRFYASEGGREIALPAASCSRTAPPPWARLGGSQPLCVGAGST